MAQIHVCKGRKCWWRGSGQRLEEIEELANSLGGCTVRSTSCMGACRNGPCIRTIKNGMTQMHYGVGDLKGSTAIVEKATGKKVNATRQVAVEEGRPARGKEASLAAKPAAGGSARAKEVSLAARPVAGKEQGPARGKVAGKREQSGRGQDENLFAKMCACLRGSQGGSESEDEADVGALSRAIPPAALAIPAMPPPPPAAAATAAAPAAKAGHRDSGFVPWKINAVTVVSKWSAVWHCSTSDSGRGRVAGNNTWHVTLSAKPGSKEAVERDYTPISSAEDWDKGSCDLLIKVYPDGKATSWLHSLPIGAELLLSPPKPTLRFPSLVPEGEKVTTRNKSILLVAGGTGIAPAWQIMETCRASQLQTPVTLIYSCRKDDALMVKSLARFVEKNKQSRIILNLTEPSSDIAKPFPMFASPEPDLRATVGKKLQVNDGRIDRQLLQTEVSSLPRPLRAVVSGPETMNLAVQEMLLKAGLDTDSITLLEA